MKIAIVGAASSYTPELLDGLFARLDTLCVSEIAMMDPNAERLSVISGLASRMAARRGKSLRIWATSDLASSIEGAKFVIAQIRVGGSQARVRDERFALDHGLIGQETTGIGGFACALRTIPAILRIARAMEIHAPEGVLLNFTNPAGIITEALIKHSAITAVGLCNIPIGITFQGAEIAGCSVDEVELDYVGLNHLSWVRRFYAKGRDVTDSLFSGFRERAGQEWEVEAIREKMVEEMDRLGMVCNPYLQYFYAPELALENQRTRGKTRAEEVQEIEAVLFEKYAEPHRNAPPEELSQRGGAHYSTAALRIMEAIEHDTCGTHIVCCKNSGAIPTLEADVAVEVPASIGAHGARAKAQDAPEGAINGLMQCLKRYESLTVEAAVGGDRAVALRAMEAHPLMPAAGESAGLLEELLEANRGHLGETFFAREPAISHD